MHTQEVEITRSENDFKMGEFRFLEETEEGMEFLRWGKEVLSQMGAVPGKQTLRLVQGIYLEGSWNASVSA